MGGTRGCAREQMRGHIAHHRSLLNQWQERIAELEQGSNSMLTKRLKNTPREEWEATVAYKRFTYEGLIARAEAEIQWATRGLDSHRPAEPLNAAGRRHKAADPARIGGSERYLGFVKNFVLASSGRCPCLAFWISA